MKLPEIVISGKHRQFEMTIFFEEYYAVSCYQLTVCLNKNDFKMDFSIVPDGNIRHHICCAVNCYQLTVYLNKNDFQNGLVHCFRWKHPTPHLTLSKDAETSSARRNPRIFKTFFAIQC